jgi:hypothetical protein
MTTSAPLRVQEAPSTAEIEVVASRCVEELDEAMSIVHDGFVQSGYLAPQPSGRRLHPSYLNPGTIFFVARMEGHAVGTCALIADGPFPLPSDRAFVEENDRLREETGLPLHECGSLAVREEARRHTRRIVMRLVAAMSRVSAERFPMSAIPLAVGPENRRFYAALVGAEEVAGERPLYGPPAVLLRTSGIGPTIHAAQRLTPIQRTMDDLITERDPSWLTLRRPEPLPAAWLQRLIDEQGATRALSEQVGLLAAHHPHALERVLAGTRASLAA